MKEMVHFNNQTPWWILFTYHDLCCWWKPVIVVVMILLKVGKQWTLPDSASIVFLLLKIDFTKVFLLEMVCVCVRIWGGKRHSVVSFFFCVTIIIYGLFLLVQINYKGGQIFDWACHVVNFFFPSWRYMEYTHKRMILRRFIIEGPKQMLLC